MTLSLTEDQALLKDVADGFFADKAPVNAMRAMRDSQSTFEPALWAEIGAMGFAGALIDEAYGGSGMGMRAMGLALEAQARTLGTSPLFQTGLIGAIAFDFFATPDQKAQYLHLIGSGQLRLALAFDEGAHHAPSQIATRAVKTASGWQIEGKKRFVQGGNHADLLLVCARIDEGSAQDLALFLVDPKAKGVAVTPRESVDSRDWADISFTVAEVMDAACLGGGVLDPAKLDLMLDYCRLGICCEMLGLISACFDMTHEYLKTRTQFGQLIGSFQALQHRAAAMLVEIELTKSCVVGAFEALETGKDVGQAVSLAKARTGETLQLVSNETIQLHGGIGMTDAHDSGLYIKRARVLEAQFGSSAFHRDRWAKLEGY
ncbi:acyl-CoA dehydrogenase family protein [Candidatus Phycosocius spiralis]|uniref:Acyl-CoA dehydrogenase n=1 Tax=Candidatus Phycosocius spiralis TaxID=2815099 RepID=A0ABQ4PUT7_9PROT|nr:acyl-CoA dehydrogenase family protein [Candidatus Phycosocius spiralis]GIU66749.1 acyl-CoA dehydrogenase [Candidatus Phycosocius spiralis]